MANVKDRIPRGVFDAPLISHFRLRDLEYQHVMRWKYYDKKREITFPYASFRLSLLPWTLCKQALCPTASALWVSLLASAYLPPYHTFTVLADIHHIRHRTFGTPKTLRFLASTVRTLFLLCCLYFYHPYTLPTFTTPRVSSGTINTIFFIKIRVLTRI